AQPEQPLVRRALGRPLVEQLREIRGMPERMRALAGGPADRRAQRRLTGLDAIDANEIARFALHVRHAAARPRLERGAKAPPGVGGIFCHAALLAVLLGQEHDDAIGLAVAIGSKHERVGGEGPHSEWPMQTGLCIWRTICLSYLTAKRSPRTGRYGQARQS